MVIAKQTLEIAQSIRLSLNKEPEVQYKYGKRKHKK